MSVCQAGMLGPAVASGTKRCACRFMASVSQSACLWVTQSVCQSGRQSVRALHVQNADEREQQPVGPSAAHTASWPILTCQSVRQSEPWICRMLMNGDSSQWDRALRMPHYNSRAMPAISFHTGVHLVQWARSGRFTLFDHGSPSANRQVASSRACHIRQLF